jgi:hypothetical protein
MAGAIQLISSFADFPVVNRWHAYGLLVVVAAFMLTASYSGSVRRVFRVTVVAAVVVALALIHQPQLQGRPSAPARNGPPSGPVRPQRKTDKAASRPLTRTIGGDPVTTVAAFGLRWVVDRSGRVTGFDDRGAERSAFSVPGPATGMVACGDALVIVYADGWVGRFAPDGGARLSHYHFGWDSDSVACGGGSVWLNKPSLEAVLRLDARTLVIQYQLVVDIRVTAIAYGHGSVWGADSATGDIVGFATDRHVIARLRGLPDPKQLVVGESGIPWVLHGQDSCLVRIDVARQREVGPGVPLGRLPVGMAIRDDVIYVLDYVDASVRTVDAESGDEVHPPVDLGPSKRLVALDERAGTVNAISADGALVLADKGVLEHGGRPRAAHRSDDCPSRAG